MALNHLMILQIYETRNKNFSRIPRWNHMTVMYMCFGSLWIHAQWAVMWIVGLNMFAIASILLSVFTGCINVWGSFLRCKFERFCILKFHCKRDRNFVAISNTWALIVFRGMLYILHDRLWLCFYICIILSETFHKGNKDIPR